MNKLKGGMTTCAFARLIDVNYKTLDQMLKGDRKPSVLVVKAICEKCDVSADWLLGLPNKRPQKTTVK